MLGSHIIKPDITQNSGFGSMDMIKMKIDITKENIFVTLYSDDLGRLMNKNTMVYTGLKIDGREIVMSRKDDKAKARTIV